MILICLKNWNSPRDYNSLYTTKKWCDRI